MSLATQKIDWRIVASGDSCLVVEIRTAPAAGRIDPVLASQWAGAAATALRQAGLPGGTDVVPAMVTGGLAPQGLIDLRAGAQGRVLMMGFAPGLPYIGSFDTRLAVPRRPQPRMAVQGGSIRPANRQGAIYPFALPGGWSLIGRTPM